MVTALQGSKLDSDGLDSSHGNVHYLLTQLLEGGASGRL